MAGNFYDGTEAELYTGSQHFVEVLGPAPATYGLTEAQLTSYGSVNGVYMTAYLTAINPDTRTQGAIAAKNAAKGALKAEARKLAAIIRATPSVTAQMLIDLGLKPRAQRLPRPAPDTQPLIDVDRVEGRDAIIKLHGDASRRGKPKDVAWANVFTAEGPVAPSDPAAWLARGQATRTKFRLEFPPSETGTTVWITAAWSNARGEVGTACQPVRVELPASAVLPQTQALKMAA